MPAKRFFSESHLLQNKPITIEGAEHHHLTKVMRCKEGEIIEIVNGRGALAEAKIEKVTRRDAICSPFKIFQQPEEREQLVLVQAITRPNRLEFIIEKGTELGVAHFKLFPGIQSEKGELSKSQKERLNSLTISALKQCGRLHLPTLSFLPELSRWQQPEGVLLYGDIGKEAPPLLNALQQDSSYHFFIGPEKGFTDQEIEQLNDWKALGVKLHKNILRSDTAALCAISMVSGWLVCLD